LRAEPWIGLWAPLQTPGVLHAHVIFDLAIIQRSGTNLSCEQSPGHRCLSSGSPFLTRRGSPPDGHNAVRNTQLGAARQGACVLPSIHGWRCGEQGQGERGEVDLAPGGQCSAAQHSGGGSADPKKRK
jgi:hypothetical protein